MMMMIRKIDCYINTRQIIITFKLNAQAMVFVTMILLQSLHLVNASRPHNNNNNDKYIDKKETLCLSSRFEGDDDLI